MGSEKKFKPLIKDLRLVNDNIKKWSVAKADVRIKRQIQAKC